MKKQLSLICGFMSFVIKSFVIIILLSLLWGFIVYFRNYNETSELLFQELKDGGSANIHELFGPNVVRIFFLGVGADLAILGSCSEEVYSNSSKNSQLIVVFLDSGVCKVFPYRYGDILLASDYSFQSNTVDLYTNIIFSENISGNVDVVFDN